MERPIHFGTHQALHYLPKTMRELSIFQLDSNWKRDWKVFHSIQFPRELERGQGKFIQYSGTSPRENGIIAAVREAEPMMGKIKL